jgi:hypothetical protein
MLKLCLHKQASFSAWREMFYETSCNVRFQVLTAASMMFRIVFWDVLPDDGGSTHLWNVGRQSFYTAVHPRRQFWTSCNGLSVCGLARSMALKSSCICNGDVSSLMKEINFKYCCHQRYAPLYSWEIPHRTQLYFGLHKTVSLYAARADKRKGSLGQELVLLTSRAARDRWNIRHLAYNPKEVNTRKILS